MTTNAEVQTLIISLRDTAKHGAIQRTVKVEAGEAADMLTALLARAERAERAERERDAEKALADRLEALLPEPLEGIDEYAAPELTEWDNAVAEVRAAHRKARGL